MKFTFSLKGEKRLKILFLLLTAVYVVLSFNSILYGGDFEVYLNAAERLLRRENIYAPPLFKGLQYYYSTLFALVLIPFTVNWSISAFLWLLLSGGLFIRICLLIRAYFDTTVFSLSESMLWMGISILFVVRFLLYNISTVQVTIFLLWVILESIRLFEKEKLFMGAALLAFGINMKILPIIVLPYLLYRSHFKASFLTIAFLGLYLILPSVVLGWEFNTFLLSEWWRIINPMNAEHLIEADLNAQSIVGIVPAFVMDLPSAIPIKRNFLALSTETTTTLVNIIRLLLVLLSLFLLKTPFQKQADRLHEVRAIAYILLVVPLIFPHQQKYSFIFIFPMLCYLWYYILVRLKKKKDVFVLRFLVVLVLCSAVFLPFIGADLIGRYAYDSIHYFKILGICTCSLIVFACLANPSHLKKLLPSSN